MMGTVFANGLEIVCKAQGNKVIADFPDVCFTPPENPATPPGVPVPYPSFGFDTDTTSGTGSVTIGGTTVSQKNKSYYSKTSGTEAGCAAKKNVITSVNTGKSYSHAWSTNVKAEGNPVCRFSDIHSDDHASPTPGAPPIPIVGQPGAGGGSTPCAHTPHAVEKPDDRDQQIANWNAAKKKAQEDQAAAQQETAKLDAELKVKPKLRKSGMTNTQIAQAKKKADAALSHAQSDERIADGKLRGLNNEKKVSDDEGGTKSYSIRCSKCNEELQELDIVTKDGRAKEVKSSSAGFDNDKFEAKKKFVETDQLLAPHVGPGAICKVAIVGMPSAQVVADHPQLAGRTQDH